MNKILFNGLIYEKNGAGISRYAYKLMETFINEGYPIDMIVREEVSNGLEGSNVHRVSRSITSSSKRIIEEQIRQLTNYKNYKVVHFPDYATPVFYNGLKVATIHDMAMKTMSDKYTRMQNLTKNTLLASTIRSADQLICDSEFTKKELLAYYPEAQDRVKVVYLGLDIPTYLKNEAFENETLIELGIRCPYILYVGTIAPHKNITKLIEAFGEVRKQYDYQLVIAGKKGWMYDEVFEKVRQKGLEKEVIFTDFILDEKLEVLYHRAVFFMSISLYEGFGFPPLEAMGRGCPVLVSDIEVFREMCGKAALYCNPRDQQDIVRKMLEMLEETEKENKRKEWVARGNQQVKRFNWKETASKVYEVYEKLLVKQLK